jgi:hypothetical protein
MLTIVTTKTLRTGFKHQEIHPKGAKNIQREFRFHRLLSVSGAYSIRKSKK